MTKSASPQQFPVVVPRELTAHPVESERTSHPQVVNFTDFFEREFDYVWHTLRRLGIEDASLEDLAHDVFLAVYERLDRYDPSRPVRPWLFGFAFRIASNYRGRSRHRHELRGEAADPPDPAPSALEQAVLLESAEHARRALESLELNRRAVFILHELDEVAMSEVARALEIPLNTAYSRLRLARADLALAVRRMRLRGLP